MKLLHTSDWHLGQSFFTKTRKNEHQAFMQWLLQQVESEQIDAVIIAGDIFDTGTPPSYARELYNHFVVELQKRQCRLVVLGGNHDAVAVLNESRQLLACLNSYVIASTDLPLTEQVILLPDRSGAIGAIVCAVPFIRAKDILQSSAGTGGLEKRQALGEAIAQHYQAIYAYALELRQQQQLEVPIITTGHLTALGVSQSESVREIYIGTLDGFAAEGFPPADYIALGHIHRPQKVAKTEHIRYSGSPIPLSFDELNTEKQVVVVEFTGAKRQHIRTLAVPQFQPMQVLRGDLAELARAIPTVAANYPEQTVWLCLEVMTEDFLPDLQQRIQKLVEGSNVDILQLKRLKNAKRQALTSEQQQTLAELTPEQVFAKRLAMEDFTDETAEARRNRIQQHFTQLVSELAQGQQS
ncbi:exonuclease subunit SbcD [Alishewanella sp. d11]|uniref:exonuclease subunit SbcD n=1 Tax=Alishewanella sp. d11 TaxID=3414030 RepID=UPI003BF8FEB3